LGHAPLKQQAFRAAPDLDSAPPTWRKSSRARVREGNSRRAVKADAADSVTAT